MDRTSLRTEVKELLVSGLRLTIDAREITDEAPIFGRDDSGAGLGLDSIDALELGLAIQKRFGVKIDAEAKDTHKHFANVASLAAFVSSQRAA